MESSSSIASYGELCLHFPISLLNLGLDNLPQCHNMLTVRKLQSHYKSQHAECQKLQSHYKYWLLLWTHQYKGRLWLLKLHGELLSTTAPPPLRNW